MTRIFSVGLLVTALCSVQSGCCCCRLPFAAMRGAPIVVNPPPVVVNPPPVNQPPVNQPPVNQPPVNQPPVNQPPVNQPPVNQPPANQPKTVKYQYYANTGQLKSDGKVIGTGFSGKGAAKNDPASYKEPIAGVIPQGDWRVERRRNDPKTGEPIIELKHWTGGHVKGRIPGESFTIHPDNSPSAGESGIAMPRNVRDAIPLPKGPFDNIIIEVREDKSVPPAGKTYTYSQRTGELKLGNEVIGTGYSGKDKGKNNPVMQSRKSLGPVPRGEYTIIGRFPDDQNAGFKLKTQPLGNTSNRYPAEEFWIVAESIPPGRHPASYIVLPREVFDRIEYRDDAKPRLKVVP